MRLRLLASTLLLAIALPACGSPGPAAADAEWAERFGAAREAMRRETAEERAPAILDLYHRWDDLRAARTGLAPRDHGWWRESFEWLQPRLGTCRAPERVNARGDDSHGRFRYACENGAFELEMWIDLGIVDRVLLGARGIDAPEAVRAAAEEVVAAMPLGDPELDRWPAGDDFLSDFAVGLGRCEIAGTDLVSLRGGLFYLECEGGPAHFKVELDPRDGEPRILRLWGPPPEELRFLGPQAV
ncbi:MAG: hypothetical protein R3B09_18675 [Nannocystaceae bacterium]